MIGQIEHKMEASKCLHMFETCCHALEQSIQSKKSSKDAISFLFHIVLERLVRDCMLNSQ